MGTGKRRRYTRGATRYDSLTTLAPLRAAGVATLAASLRSAMCVALVKFTRTQLLLRVSEYRNRKPQM